MKRQAEIPRVSNEECYGFNLTIEDSQICAGGQSKDSCRGDSGGPLMSVDTSDLTADRWYIEGITSFGSQMCGQENVPAVYTRVDYYVDWIKENMRP